MVQTFSDTFNWQKLEQSVIFKDKGTEFFKQKKYELAANKYNKVIGKIYNFGQF